jgi:hypothetical protein
MIGLDFNLAVWRQTLERAAKKIENKADVVMKDAAQQTLDEVVKTTPVGDPSLWKYPAHKDYKPGTLKASWSMETSKNHITISNSQPYASRVENGWSSQAPNGMLRRALMKFNKFLANAVRKN